MGELLSLSHATKAYLIAPEKNTSDPNRQFFVGTVAKGDKPDGRLKHAERYRTNGDESHQGTLCN